MGIPTNQGSCGGSRSAVAAPELKTQRQGVDTALAQVQTILKTVKEHHLCQGHTGQAAGVDPAVDRGGPAGRPDTLVVAGLGERRDRVTTTRSPPCTPCTRWPRPHPTDRAVDHDGRRSQRQNRACRCDAGAGDRAPQGREGRRVWPALLSRLGGGYVFGTMIRGVVDESKMPLQGPGDLPHDLWGARHPHTDSLRPGRLCHSDPCGAPTKGSRRLAFSPRAKGCGALPRPSARRCAASGARPKAS